MSAIENNSDHLRTVARSSNNPYRLQSNKDTNRVPATVTVVRSSRMGGMVSTLSAVLCGASKQSSTEDIYIQPATNGYHQYNGDYSSQPSQVEIALDTSKHNKHESLPRRNDSYCENSSDDSNSEYCEASELLTPPTNYRQLEAIQHLNLRYMDSDSDVSRLSSSEQKLAAENCIEHYTTAEEIIEVSETEYSADEEQEEEKEEIIRSDTEELERIDSELEDERSEDGHVCNSDCEHSEEEIEDESEPASEGEEEEEDHVCNSQCDHSDLEENTQQSEYDSEYESDGNQSESEQNLINSDGEVIEVSENEVSCDEEQQSENEESDSECGSECPSDCDGRHHECSSECGCDVPQSDSDVEDVEQNHSNRHDTLETDHSRTSNMVEPLPDVSQVNNSESHIPPPCPIPSFRAKQSLNKLSPLPPSTEILSQISGHKLKPTERNNNRIQRNHSQRILQRSNTADMMGELRSAIKEHVRRSASCRETATDYRKKYAQISNAADVTNNLSKLDLHERETRRKDRRTRLRTLELKREQCLDELRDGVEENVTERVYKDTMMESG